jgi:hypothetical protein
MREPTGTEHRHSTMQSTPNRTVLARRTVRAVLTVLSAAAMTLASCSHDTVATTDTVTTTDPDTIAVSTTGDTSPTTTVAASDPPTTSDPRTPSTTASSTRSTRSTGTTAPTVPTSRPAGTRPSTPTSTPRPGDVDELVLQVSSCCGFTPYEWVLRNVPGVSVYRDGRVITSAPIPAIYPGPAMLPLNESHIASSKLDELVKLVTDAGLAREPIDFGQPPVADAPSTMLTVNVGGKFVTQTANALGIDDGVPGTMTDTQRDARRRLQAVVNAVGDAVHAAGSTPRAYSPTAISVYVRPSDAASSGEPKPNELRWPLATDLAGVQPDAAGSGQYGCLAVTGADARQLLVVLNTGATETTRWKLNDKPISTSNPAYNLVLRPALPGETPCTLAER